MYNYRSPLQDEEFYEVYRQHERGPWPGLRRPFPPRIPPPSHHRLPGPHPYLRPGPTSQVPSYSSRYQLSTYPKELNKMFGALECKLCSVEVTSPIGAKMHYSGKPHMKKVKNFLTEWSLKTGNPIPNFEQDTPEHSASSLASYCELCDVRLISTNDKMLHYSGKTHRKNERDPANAKKKTKTYDTIDLSATDARFGIGIGFSSDSKALPATVPENIQVTDFVCELCDVKAVSQEQLNIHLGGKKHQDKLKKKEAGVPKAGSCEVCDVTFNSFIDYQSHINGKKHEKKMRQNAFRTPVIVKDQKQAITCKNCQYIGHAEDHVCDKSLENNTIKKKDTDGKWKCTPCYNMTFATEEEYEEHKKTRRHLLCMLNVEGDKISEDKIHYYCFTCRKQYLDNKDYCAHLFSHKHITLSDERVDLGSKTDLWHCRVCAIVMDQEAKEEHLGSKHHLLQAAQQDITRTLTELANEDLGTNTFHCTHCDINFVSFVAFSDHMLDIKHMEEIVSTKLVAAGVKIE